MQSVHNEHCDYIYLVIIFFDINGGEEAIKHFTFLLNTVIENINNASLPEINTAYANILHKGHGKDKSKDNSHRTISTCPLIAKSLDLYVREDCIDAWDSHQAETQFQGSGTSHEHKALLLTEVIQHALNIEKKPIFALFLDAKSAFDKALHQILCRRLYIDGTPGHNLSYLIQRLQSRITFCEWDKQLMEPIDDKLGVEQGGVNSSDLYKIFNNEQLQEPQNIGFGISIGSIHVASIGQTDDTVLVSSDLYKLKFLLDLTLDYCKKYHVELLAGKIQLLLYSPSGFDTDKEYLKASNYISIDGIPIETST